MNVFRSSVLLLALAAVHSGEAADPAAKVAGWIKALQANDLTTAWDALPAAQRTAWSASLAPTPPPVGVVPADGGRARGGRGGGSMLDMPLRMLAEGDQAAQGGRLLAATLAGMAGAMSLDGKAPASVALPSDQPFLAFVPRMASIGLLGGVMQGVLARGLETRQIAAVDAWSKSFVTWAATAPLTDEQRAAAAQPHLQAFAVAARTPAAPAAATPAAPAAATPAAGAPAQPATPDLAASARSVLAAWSSGLPRLKQALAVYGLDADAALASAQVTAEPAAADGSVTVVVRFKAFAADQTLPLKLAMVDGGWAISADSPVLRWMRGGAGGMGGMMGGMGRGGPGGAGGMPRRRPDAGGPPDAPPADAPRQGGPVGF